MGLPTISSDTELASDRDGVHSEAQAIPKKSNTHRPRKPKAKQIVVKEFIKSVEDPGIHQNCVPYVGKNSVHRRI